ncbi:MAG: DUF881 domain-containing protein [Clostridiales bacterium]|nr:DUF881 domain-containing protein [Clostridiales bacterium]
MKAAKPLVGAFCFLIGLFLVSQFGVTEGQSVYVSAKAVGEYSTSIESEKREIENIKDRISDAEEQLAKYEAAQGDDDFSEITDELVDEISKYKMFSGYETVQGPGVKVTIDDGTRALYDGEDINVVLVHDVDIIMIINDLKRCGAEAISVNGQRIVDRTEISCSGYTVRINGQVFARPFVIRAIGDGKRMSANLLSYEGYGTLLKTYGVQFSVELAEDIVIQGYAGPAAYKYMTNV